MDAFQWEFIVLETFLYLKWYVKRLGQSILILPLSLSLYPWYTVILLLFSDQRGSGWSQVWQVGLCSRSWQDEHEHKHHEHKHHEHKEHDHSPDHEHKHHEHKHEHEHAKKEDIPAWKKRAMESGDNDPMAAPFGGTWNTESSLSATDTKMEE